MSIETEDGQRKNIVVRTLENTAVVKHTAFVGGLIGIGIIIKDGANNNALGAGLPFAFTVICAIVVAGAAAAESAEKSKFRI